MKGLLCSLFVLLLPRCGPEVGAIQPQGSFEVLEDKGELQTASCSKTARGKGGKLLAIDMRPGSNRSTYVVRINIRQNITTIKPGYTSHCAAGDDEMSLGISCLRSPLLDLTRERLICDYREKGGEGFDLQPEISTTSAYVMDCRLQADSRVDSTKTAAEQGLAQQSYNVQIDTGRVRLESKDVSDEAFSRLVICKTTTAKGGLVLCRKTNSSLTIIVTKDVLDSKNHASLQCRIQKENVSVWSKSASIDDKPNDSPECVGYKITVGILAPLLVGVCICCGIILFKCNRLKKGAQRKSNTSVTAQKLMESDLDSPETSPQEQDLPAFHES